VQHVQFFWWYVNNTLDSCFVINKGLGHHFCFV
jgi:hypothetical protein